MTIFNGRNSYNEQTAQKIMAEAYEIHNNGRLIPDREFWDTDPADFAVIDDTVADFLSGPFSRGKPVKSVPHAGIVMLIRDDVQVAKGLRRGTAYIADFGAFRCAYFDGETA